MTAESSVALGVDSSAAKPIVTRFGAVLRVGILLALALILAQAIYVVQARPQDLITGISGMKDLISRAMPPDYADFPNELWPALETIDIAIFGTFFAVVLALPLAVLAAHNTTPARPVYYVVRALIAIFRSVPDLVWALLFVTAVGLGPFAGAIAITINSMGMLGRLLAEVIEDMDMGPMDALASTGAGRLQVFSHAVVPSVLPSLMGITLYQLDANIRSSVVLGFVGAGGIGFQLLTAMNLFQYPDVALLIIMMFVIVIGAERMSAALRKRVA
jgi:phosphonate transport system permease protein